VPTDEAFHEPPWLKLIRASAHRFEKALSSSA